MAPDPNEALEWAKVLVAAVGGGFIVKLLDIAYLELRRRDDKRQSAGRFIDQHLDPLLKAADELTGKLLSLAREDFKTFSGVNGANPYKHPDFASTAYLISRFWSQVEILKHQALYVSISQTRPVASSVSRLSGISQSADLGPDFPACGRRMPDDRGCVSGCSIHRVHQVP